MVAFVTRVKDFAREFWADTSGIVLPYVTIMLVVIIGVSVLAVDGARMSSLQTQLQKAADALALAAARELDGRSDAFTRADAALANLVNTTLPGMGNANVELDSRRFLRRLPELDTQPISSAHLATSTTNGRYIEVTVRPVTLPTLLPAGFFGGATSVTAGASAVAGTSDVACEITPMYICNPFEQAGDDYDTATQRLLDAAADPATKRRLMTLRNNPGDSQLPGNYGFLNAPQSNGFNAVRDAIAKVRSPVCLRQRGVDFQTGFGGGAIAPAFNVRHDVYDASMNANKNDPDYAPALNVRKGYWLGSGSNWCQAEPCKDNASCNNGTPDDGTQPGLSDDKAMAPPCDADMGGPFTCHDPPAGPLGDGNWDFELYWNTNHQGVSLPNGWSNTNLPTRYQVYQYEIAQGSGPGGINDASDPSASPPTPNPQEIGAPRCNTNTPPASTDRRVLYVAVINCQALGLGGGSQNNVPVAAFGKVFMSKPVDGSTGDILGEMVELAGPGTGNENKFDRQVQLYR
jgi:Flp pilus assembly protein TadG